MSKSSRAARAARVALDRTSFAFFSLWRSKSANDTRFPARTSHSVGGWYSGTAVKKVTRAPLSRANSIPAATPFSATSEPSVGMRICLYTRISLLEAAVDAEPGFDRFGRALALDQHAHAVVARPAEIEHFAVIGVTRGDHWQPELLLHGPFRIFHLDRHFGVGNAPSALLVGERYYDVLLAWAVAAG